MRLLRGLGALVALVLGVAGIPLALVALGGNPFPRELTWTTFSRAFLRPDDGSVVLGLITVIAWLGWFVFALSLLLELANALSGYRLQLRLPGFAAPQRLVAGLLLTVLAVTAVPVSATDTAVPAANPAATAPQQVEPAVPAVPSAAPVSPAPALAPDQPVVTADQPVVTAGSGTPSRTHLVERGDDLWSMAAHYYGEGRQWRKIAKANPRLLSGGPDRLQVGWKLTIPDVASTTDATGVTSSGPTVVVERGDTLSSIAEDVFGEAWRWTDIYEENSAKLNDPNVIQVGSRLELPAPAQRVSQSKAADRQTKPPTSEPRPESREPTQTARTQPAPPSAAPSSRSQPAPFPSPTTRAQGSTPDVLPGPNQRASDTHDVQETTEVAALDVAVGVASVGGLLAAAVLGVLSLRRRLQLQSRRVGQRIGSATPVAQTMETALGRRQTPLMLHTLDLAARAIAAHCHEQTVALPPLALVKVGPDAIEFVLDGPAAQPPVGFTVSGRCWILASNDAHYLSSIPRLKDSPTPYPGLVTLGHDHEGQQVLVDLEGLGALAVTADQHQGIESVLAAMALEMSCSPWAGELTLTLVGSASGLPEALQQHNVTHNDHIEELLERLEHRAATQQAHSEHVVLGQNRIDPDRADFWSPEILLIGQPLSSEQERRLVAVATGEPRASVAVVMAEPSVPVPWSLTLYEQTPAVGSLPASHHQSVAPEHVSALTEPSVLAVLHPLGLELRPQLLPATASNAVLELVHITGTEETTPAPWWDHGDEVPLAGAPPDPRGVSAQFGWGLRSSESMKGTDVVVQQPGRTGGAAVHHPVLLLLGPVELVGATGALPPRAGKQCLEYCGWLLEHPGTTAQAMASGLVVAEGTRRSNMSRLRAWLGADPHGDAFLPDAYTGRIVLHPSVSSDWQRLQILTAAGVNKTSTEGLLAALELVRGAPLADAAPGQWHWAEELRTDMISAVRDIGVEVASRALTDSDVDLARWAASRALAAAPGDELLLAIRIRTEHKSGNVADTERLTLQLAAQARSLGVDLEPGTVALLQEVMEGRVRAQLA